MRVLMLSGEGPYFKNSIYLDGTLFDDDSVDALQEYFAPLGGLSLAQLCYRDSAGTARPLLRPKHGLVPHLTSFTMESILASAGFDFEMFDLGGVWDGTREPAGDPDVVLLSTTFICDAPTLRRALAWIRARWPAAILVLGGQYSNLKFRQILEQYPTVDCVVRGDGEVATPTLLRALAGHGDLDGVPNLVGRSAAGTLLLADISYVDLEAFPSPSFPGPRDVVPYESMRGCPFSCKFCSFPAASPKWRYKSASKISEDWRRYVSNNAASHIRAMDSTFTVPPVRLRELLPMLVDAPCTWEAYTRANSISSPALVDALAAAHCSKLVIGFESMSPAVLSYMDKRVTVAHNRRAHLLLRDSPVGYRTSFMVGYPGETPEDFELTHRYLREEYSGHFMLALFSLVDETMPVWDDAERFDLRVLDPQRPDYGWEHCGMSEATARRLMRQALDDIRWGSDEAVLLLWQTHWQTPLVPHRDQRTNFWLEKLVERLGMLPRDHPDPATGVPLARRLLAELADHGIYQEDTRSRSLGLAKTGPRA